MPNNIVSVTTTREPVTVDGVELRVSSDGRLTIPSDTYGYGYQTVETALRAHANAQAEAEEKRQKAREKRERAARTASGGDPQQPVTALYGPTLERVTVRGRDTRAREQVLITLADGTKTSVSPTRLLADLPDGDPRLERLVWLREQVETTKAAEEATKGMKAKDVLPKSVHATAYLDPETRRFTAEVDGETFTGDTLGDVTAAVFAHALRDTYPWTVGAGSEVVPLTAATTYTEVWPTREAVEAHLAATTAAAAVLDAFTAQQKAVRFDTALLP